MPNASYISLYNLSFSLRPLETRESPPRESAAALEFLSTSFVQRVLAELERDRRAEQEW